MQRSGKILKIPVGPNPVLLKAEETVRRESHAQAEIIVSEAHAAAERIRAEAIELTQSEKTRAEWEAARVVREAEENRDALIHEASEKARAQARQEVLDEFRPQIEEAVEFFQRTVEEAEKVWRGEFDRHKQEVIALALGVAEKIVHKISKEDRELVRRTAEVALEKAVDRQEVTLRVNPEDFAVLENYRIELLNRFEDLRTFKIEEDRRVDRGGAWIETPSGFVDARIRNQLEEIIASVLPGAEKKEPESSQPDTEDTPTTE